MTDEVGSIIEGKEPAVLTGAGGAACAPFRYRIRGPGARGGLLTYGRLAVPVACYDANAIDFTTKDPA
ncbi:hypothetical protein ABZ759_12760 [Streptomyces sp. NPDC047860]|uniref:hypothetical protein n=1 Tax=Streptomyces sp. NPDC047860 TaxID=3155743 RepID=UPI0033EBEE6E